MSELNRYDPDEPNDAPGRDGPHVRHIVDDYLHELLSEPEAERVREHCAQCSGCRQALEAARERHAVLTSLPPVEASQSLIQAAVGRVSRREDRRQQVWWYWSRGVAATAAAIVLVLGGLHVYFATLRPTPYDIRVLGQDQLLAGTEARLRIGVFDRTSGRPVAGAPVEVQLRDRRNDRSIRLAGFRTGPDGSQAAMLELPEWDDGTYDLRIVADTGRRPETLSRPITLRRASKLMLTTDKPVYQPGQTIRIRSLALRRPDLEPVAGEPVTFQIEDPRGNRIFKQTETSSRFGIAHTDCPLGRDITEGDYQLECRVGQVSSRLTLEVRKYVLPKFKVSVELDKTYYLPGDEAQATIQADYFFGQPVAGANVVVVPSSGQRSQRPIKAETDAEGRVVVPVTVPSSLVGRPQEGGAAPWEIIVQVTDSAGQAEAVRAATRVADQPIQLAVVPAGGTLVDGLPNPIFIHATYPDGQPVAARIRILGLDRELTTDPLGIATFELTPQGPTRIVELTATDDRGNRTRRRVELSASEFSGDFLLLPDRGVYRGGDTVQLTFRGGGVEPVFVDVLRDGQTVLSRSVPMSGGRGQLDMDLPADLFGPLRIVAYRFDASGLAARRSRMIFVKRADDLRIQAELDAEQYRPGEQARLRLRVTDSQDRPVPGAVSLAIVDEAVFSVTRQRPGMERTFFQLENELLRPVYTIYGWSPFDEPPDVPEEQRVPEPQRIRFEQSLFARTAHAATGRSVVPVRLASGPVRDGTVRDGTAPRGPRRNQFWQPSAERPGAKAAEPEPFTLAAASFPEKAAGVSRLQRRRLAQITLAWVVAAALLVLACVAALAYFRPVVFLAMAAFGLTGTCMLGIPLILGLPIGCMSEMSVGSAASDRAASGVLERPMPLDGAEAAGIQPREDFPETLLWRPELITDDQGTVQLDIDLADSITTWRVTAGAVSGAGQLGGERLAIRVFQPFFVDFNLPVALTRHDQVAVPVVVYNYLDQPQTVEITLQADDWFELLPGVGEQSDGDSADSDSTASDSDDSDAAKENAADSNPPSLIRRLELQPGEVRSVHFPIRALRVGRHRLEVQARGGEIADAVRREVEVVPNGRRTEQVESGLMNGPWEMPLEIPDDIVPGSAGAVLTLHPTYFSQLVDGLDSILRMPHGCFEQTSSTTYPNVLALRYLRSSGTISPAVEAKARQYIHVGYQRLITFEVGGGGFSWFGRPPANALLTAYGLLEFQDMAEVHDVDPALITRTRNWLRSRREADGGWPVDERFGEAEGGPGGARLKESAYIAWAVARSGGPTEKDRTTLDFLLAHEPASIEDPYTLALVIKAIAALEPNHGALAEYTARLLEMTRRDESRTLAWWEQSAGETTSFHGDGMAGRIETTAMAVMALQAVGGDPGTIGDALHWIVAQKDSAGTWHSTQATVLALQCLLGGAPPRDDEPPRRYEVLIDDQPVKTLDVAPDQLDVVQRVELPDLPPGSHRLRVREQGETTSGYHLAFRYWREMPDDPDRKRLSEDGLPGDGPLSIDIRYDRRRLQVDDVLEATATVENRMAQFAPMVMVSLPVPPGFTVERQGLEALRDEGQIARYDLTPRQVIVYLNGLEAGQRLELPYRLRATMPVKVAVPDAEVYEYYNPQRRGRGGDAELDVREA